MASHRCNVCDVTPTVSRCSSCNFHFCIQHASFLHLCAEDHITRKTQLATRTQTKEAHLGGIGAWLDKLDGVVMVNALVPGGPADRSKQLFVGDVVLEIEGQNAAAIPSCQEVILGVPGTPVTLVVRRGGQVVQARIIRDVKNAPTRLDHMEVQEVSDVAGFHDELQTRHFQYQSGQVVTEREAHFVPTAAIPGASLRPITPIRSRDGHDCDHGVNSAPPATTTSHHYFPNPHFQQQLQQQQFSLASFSGPSLSPRPGSSSNPPISPRPTYPPSLPSSTTLSQPQLAGIGIIVSRAGNIMRVESVLPDGPADRILLPGDALLEINGVPAASLPSCQDALVGPPGSVVRLGIDRPSQGFFNVDIQRMRPVNFEGGRLTFASDAGQQQQQQRVTSYTPPPPPPILTQQVVSYAPMPFNTHSNNSNSVDRRSRSRSPVRTPNSASATPNSTSSTTLTRAGIGAIFLHTGDGNVVVDKLRAGGPASAHLLSGDVVLAINGLPTRGMGSCQEVVMGAPGTSVVVVVDRPGVGRKECIILRG